MWSVVRSPCLLCKKHTHTLIHSYRCYSLMHCWLSSVASTDWITGWLCECVTVCVYEWGELHCVLLSHSHFILTRFNVSASFTVHLFIFFLIRSMMCSLTLVHTHTHNQHRLSWLNKFISLCLSLPVCIFHSSQNTNFQMIKH